MHTKLDEIIEKCSKLGLITKRNITGKSCDLVFSSEATDSLEKIFIELLGPPVKPAGKYPSKYDQRLTRNYGGVWPYQKLFVRIFSDVTVICIFMPWRYGTHITIRLAVLNNIDVSGVGKSPLGVILSIPKKVFSSIYHATAGLLDRLI